MKGDLVPFVYIFPDLGEKETRTLTIFEEHEGVPADEYALAEAYCTDPTCDCRRVMLSVVSRHQRKRGYLASISYGFERDAEDAGPFLDPLNPQCDFAEGLLNL